MNGQWFKNVFGFVEKATEVKEAFTVNGTKLLSLKNDRELDAGEFTTPSVHELREIFDCLNVQADSEPKLTIKHIGVGNIYDTHHDPEYEGALFQVASQFNCLEFPSQNVIPEAGITNYIFDRTQGPACSLACPVGTLFRNYFAKTPQGQIGQSKNDQINNLSGVEDLVGNKNGKYWVTRNGYVDSTNEKLAKFNKKLNDGIWDREKLVSALRVGLQTRTQAVKVFEQGAPSSQIVSQAFCSAISISYSRASDEQWENLARIVLDGVYEATILAGLINYVTNKGSNKIVLTFIGGGVFGNRPDWIHSSICRACIKYAFYDLSVEIAYYRNVDSFYETRINNMYRDHLHKIIAGRN